MKKISTSEYGYRTLIDSFDVHVLAEAHDNNYQGDSFYLLQDGKRYGWLTFGWGSCSGCDNYEAAYGYHSYPSDDGPLYALRDSLWNDVKWFASLKEAVEAILFEDSELQWYGTSDGFKDFVKTVREYADRRFVYYDDHEIREITVVLRVGTGERFANWNKNAIANELNSDEGLEIGYDSLDYSPFGAPSSIIKG